MVAAEGEVAVYNAHRDSSGNPVPLDPTSPTFVLVPGFGRYRDALGGLAATIAAATDCFPGGHVNVLVADWRGATAGPAIDGAPVPWAAALHVATDGGQLGDLLGALDAGSQIALRHDGRGRGAGQ